MAAEPTDMARQKTRSKRIVFFTVLIPIGFYAFFIAMSILRSQH
jgi:hypothetical protein